MSIWLRAVWGLGVKVERLAWAAHASGEVNLPKLLSLKTGSKPLGDWAWAPFLFALSTQNLPFSLGSSDWVVKDVVPTFETLGAAE